MWKHKNFINLQLCAPSFAWLLELNFDSGISKVETTDVDNISCVWTTSGQTVTVQAYVSSSFTFTCTLADGYSLDTISAGTKINDTQFTVTLDSSSDNPNPITITSKQSTPTLTFKHFYDAGLQGTGTIKFRHYSQSEPSSGETWVLNETFIDNPPNTQITFTSNNTQFVAISRTSGIQSPQTIWYYTNDTDYVVACEYGTWKNQAYRTLTFDTAPTGDLLTWLQANGTKQGGGGNS